MQEYIQERCLAIAVYMLENKATVRQAAAKFGVSKSSVHKDMGERLPIINPTIAAQIAHLLAYNKAVRHLRGGAATRDKYAKLHQQA